MAKINVLQKAVVTGKSGQKVAKPNLHRAQRVKVHYKNKNKVQRSQRNVQIKSEDARRNMTSKHLRFRLFAHVKDGFRRYRGVDGRKGIGMSITRLRVVIGIVYSAELKVNAA